MFGAELPRYTGNVAWRGLVLAERVAHTSPRRRAALSEHGARAPAGPGVAPKLTTSKWAYKICFI